MEPTEQVNEVKAVKKSWFYYKRTKADRFLKSFFKFVGLFIIFLAALIVIMNEFNSSEINQLANNEGENQDCNVAGIELHGEIVTYMPPSDYDADGNILVDKVASENVTYNINDVENDDSIKAIILEVDSYGGSAVAAEEISQALKNAKKPTVALIREAGDSAAYYAATGADKIYASLYSDVGSIGITASYLDASKQNQKEGLTYNQLSSGKFKDAGDPDRALTAEEIKIFMRDINIMHQNFVKAVAENRNLDIKKVENLADGSAMLGQMALQNGLIDEIGGMTEVKNYLKNKIGADVSICW